MGQQRSKEKILVDMAVHYRTQGFILSKDDLREADQLFNIYTQDFGKLKVLGRAIRKIKSKLRPGVDLFYLSEIEFIQGKNYKTLTDALTIEKFKDIRSDLAKLETAYRIVQASDTLITGQYEDKKIFNLLKESFYRLNENQDSLIYYYFIWNLLSILGYGINLYNCVLCRKKLSPEVLYLNLEEKGISCCKQGEKISAEVVKMLRIFLEKDWKTIDRLKIGDSHKRELESISESYLIVIGQDI